MNGTFWWLRHDRLKYKDDISRFLKIALREGFKIDADIFRLDGSFALNGQMIVSDGFKQRYEESGLTGLVFSSTNGRG
jgi:hypothetical protein